MTTECQISFQQYERVYAQAVTGLRCDVFCSDLGLHSKYRQVEVNTRRVECRVYLLNTWPWHESEAEASASNDI